MNIHEHAEQHDSASRALRELREKLEKAKPCDRRDIGRVMRLAQCSVEEARKAMKSCAVRRCGTSAQDG